MPKPLNYDRTRSQPRPPPLGDVAGVTVHLAIVSVMFVVLALLITGNQFPWHPGVGNFGPAILTSGVGAALGIVGLARRRGRWLLAICTAWHVVVFSSGAVALWFVVTASRQ